MSATLFSWACGGLLTLALLLLTRPVPAQDLLEQYKKQQEIYAQKVEIELQNSLSQAQRLQTADPAKAASILQATLTKIEADSNLTKERREVFGRLIRARLRIAEAEAGKAAGRPAEPTTKLTQSVNQQAAAQQQVKESEQISRTLLQIQALQRDGRTTEANRLAQDLLQQYPDQLAAIGAGRVTSTNDVIANARSLRTEADRRIVGAMGGVDRSALPAGRDVEFPADWKNRVAKRSGMNGPPMTDKEKSILKSLATPISVSFKDARFEDIVSELADKLNQPLLLDKQSLADAQVTSDTTYSLQLKNVPTRTILRKMLGDLGLAYIIKDETIQVVTQDRAAREMVQKTYYIGDLLAGGMFNQAGIRFVPWVDQFQAMQNVNSIIQIIQTIDPASWQGNGGFGTVTFYAPSMSLIIRQTAEMHNMIGSSLR